MDNIQKKLQLLAFVLAVFAAFAFNFPSAEITARYGSHNGNVYDVTNVDMGPGANEYQCDKQTVTCLYQDQALQTPVPGSDGLFIPGSDLDPIE